LIGAMGGETTVMMKNRRIESNTELLGHSYYSLEGRRKTWRDEEPHICTKAVWVFKCNTHALVYPASSVSCIS